MAEQVSQPTDSMRNMLAATHGVGSVVSLALLIVVSLDMNNLHEKHVLRTALYTKSSAFEHPCGEKPEGSDDTFYADCIHQGSLEQHFVITPGDPKLMWPETVTPTGFIIVACVVGLFYHGALAINFFTSNSVISSIKDGLVYATGSSKYFGNVRASLKTLRYVHNVFIGIPLVWSIMALVGVGSFFDYILVAAAHLGLFNSLAVWDRSGANSQVFDALNYMLVGIFLCWYLFAAVNHEDNSLSDEVPKHGNLAMVVVVHSVYLFLYAAHLLLLRASASSILAGLEMIWDVQVDIGYSILNVGYLLTIAVGVFANYKAICKAILEPVYPKGATNAYEDDTEWYDVQLYVTITTTVVVLALIVMQTRQFRVLIGGKPAKQEFGYVKSKFSNNAQPHEGAPILGSEYNDKDDDEC